MYPAESREVTLTGKIHAIPEKAATTGASISVRQRAPRRVENSIVMKQ